LRKPRVGFLRGHTDWNAGCASNQARAELRYEYLNQDQPRAGSQTVEVGQIPAHHERFPLKPPCSPPTTTGLQVGASAIIP
jgi:hypothetical protein